jgi:hypothetical protein
MDVLFEGLLIAADVNRTVALHQVARRGMEVVSLTTPLEQCLADVNGRRRAAHQRRVEALQAENAVLAEQGRKLRPLPEERGDVNPANTTSKHRGVQQSLARLRAAGVPVSELDRDAAFERIATLLGWVRVGHSEESVQWTR